MYSLSTRSKPECCRALDSKWIGGGSIFLPPYLAASQSAQEANALVTTTITDTYFTSQYAASWLSCNSARTAQGSVWTWTDRYTRLGDVEPCSGPIFTLGPARLASLVTRNPPNMTRPILTKACDPLPDCSRCTIVDEGRMEIIYWPATLAPSNATTSQPINVKRDAVIAEYRGINITSPTVYLYYPTLYATFGQPTKRLLVWTGFTAKSQLDACGSSYQGNTYTDLMIPVPLEETLSTFSMSRSTLSSVEGFSFGLVYEYLVKEPLTYVDLPPNPVSPFQNKISILQTSQEHVICRTNTK